MTSTVVSGFDTSNLARNDDNYSSSISLGFDVNYFGTTYSQTYVSNNGYITFGQGQGSFSPSGLGSNYSGIPIIAALFADVDTRNAASGLATWGTGTFQGHAAFGATWEGVGYFSNQADKLDTFQVLLVDRDDTGGGNFDIYLNYNDIQWGNGGAAGYNAGVSGNPSGTYFQLPGSLSGNAFVNNGASALSSSTNDGTPGQWLFQVRGGSVGGASSFAIAATDADKADGTSGTTDYGFTVARSGYLGAAETLNYTITNADGSAVDPTLFPTAAGTVSFAAGDSSEALTVSVAGAALTQAQGFVVTLSSASGASLTTPTAQGTIEPNTDPNPPAPANQDVIRVSPTAIEVVRYFDRTTGTHFFTSSANESATTDADLPSLVNEGAGFLALAPEVAETDADATAVYRFFDSINGTQFLTSDVGERDHVQATTPGMIYEGIGFYEHQTAQAGDTAVYRFFDTTSGNHFYTPSDTERASLATSRPDLVYEGVSFFAPHT